MLETSARRALSNLGYKVNRIDSDGYLVTKDGERLPFDSIEDLERFILQERKARASDLRDGIRKAQIVEVSGNESKPAFTRVVATQAVKFICANCGQELNRSATRRGVVAKVDCITLKNAERRESARRRENALPDTELARKRLRLRSK